MTLLRLSVVFTALSALVSMHLASAHEAAQHVKPVSPTAQRLSLGDGKISTTPRQGYVQWLAEAASPAAVARIAWANGSIKLQALGIQVASHRLKLAEC